MAKTKKAGTGKTGKLPKQIGGIKIPKDLRKKGDALIEKANTPQGREAITAGLAMAATLAVAAIDRQRAKKAPEAKSAETEAKPGAAPGTPGVQNPQAVADAIGQAAEMMLGRFFGKKA